MVFPPSNELSRMLKGFDPTPAASVVPPKCPWLVVSECLCLLEQTELEGGLKETKTEYRTEVD